MPARPSLSPLARPTTPTSLSTARTRARCRVTATWPTRLTPRPDQMADASFDVVSEYDRQELVNAVNQAQREIGTRYDFKGTNSTLELADKEITLEADSDYKLGAMIDILKSKMVKRQVDLKVLDPQKAEPAAKGRVRQKLELRQGLSDDLARDVVKRIKADLPKLQSRIEGDKVRVTGKSRDELQAAIKLLREANLPVPLQFTNYR